MTPWELIKTSEHSHQRAVFAWANCAAMYGFACADDPLGYALATRAAALGAGPPLPVPELAYLYAVHNQGHGDAVRGGRAKAEGVKPGVPDMVLPVTREINTTPDEWLPNFRTIPGLYIELKKPKTDGKKPGRVAGVQLDWSEFLAGQGYRVVLAIGWQEATQAIKDYMLCR